MGRFEDPGLLIDLSETPGVIQRGPCLCGRAHRARSCASSATRTHEVDELATAAGRARRPRRVTAPERVTVDVSAVAPAGAARVVADVFLPSVPLDPPIVMTCLPGGGMTRRYFDIEVDGDPWTYSMARFLAGLGVGVITVDPPGVGESDVPDDPWTLTPRAVASVCATASDHLLRELRRDRPELISIGVGHSAGALLTVYTQAGWRPFEAPRPARVRRRRAAPCADARGARPRR